MNLLIAYYSWSGNTRRTAEMIRQATGGTLFEIRPRTPYSSNYNTCLEEAKRDIRAGHLPELEALPDNLDAYDAVFVGTPNWWSTLAPPVAAFLTKVDLTGKTVAPFCSHGGGGQARCASDAAKLCPHAKMLDSLAVYGGGASKDIARWLSAVGFNTSGGSL